MKKLHSAGLTGTCFFFGLAGTSHAADLPMRSPPAPPAPQAAPLDWSGFYAGVEGGYLWGTFDTDPAIFDHLKTEGPLGGGQLGYNWQHDWFVFGFEGDAAYVDARKSAGAVTTGTGFEGITITDTYSWTEKIDAVATLRARAGIAAGNVFLYGTGGFAWADVREQSNALISDMFGDLTPSSTTSNEGRVGWTIGGGAEMKINQRWSLGAQFLYMDFGSKSFDFAGIGPQRVKLTTDEATLRLNYKF